MQDLARMKARTNICTAKETSVHPAAYNEGTGHDFAPFFFEPFFVLT
jgi:hypothetical protein